MISIVVKVSSKNRRIQKKLLRVVRQYMPTWCRLTVYHMEFVTVTPKALLFPVRMDDPRATDNKILKRAESKAN